MIKTRFTAPLANGQAATRTSAGFAYTHAVVGASYAISWHTSRELAGKAHHRVVNSLGAGDPSQYRVVKVTGEQLLPKRTSAADKNAARRGVLTRQIARMVEHLAYTEDRLAAWDAGRSEQEKARLLRDFGAEYGAKLHADSDRERRDAPAWTRGRIAKLEAERAALLAAKAEA